MGLRRLLDDLQPFFQTRPAWRPFRPLFESVERFLYSSSAQTTSAPHVRHHGNAQRLDWLYVLASLPAAFAGLRLVGHSQGLALFVPLLAVAVLTAVAWEWIFALVRGRRYGHGVFLSAWLFALVAPASLPLYQAALAMSFGFVFGRAVFGGAGRNIVNPAVLALVFLYVAFPASGHTAGGTVLEHARNGGLDALHAAGIDWWAAFLTDPSAGIGPASTAAALLGAALLLAARAASWRIMLGAALGLAAAAIAARALAADISPVYALPWHWHLVAGGYVFAVAFFATDAACAPVTNAGRWIYGLLIGALTLMIRAGESDGFSAAAFALLFASIIAPLADFVAIEQNVRRRRKRTGSAGA